MMKKVMEGRTNHCNCRQKIFKLPLLYNINDTTTRSQQNEDEKNYLSGKRKSSVKETDLVINRSQTVLIIIIMIQQKMQLPQPFQIINHTEKQKKVENHTDGTYQQDQERPSHRQTELNSNVGFSYRNISPEHTINKVDHKKTCYHRRRI